MAVDTTLKISYQVSVETLYEVKDSNARHFDKINEQQTSAMGTLASVPEVSDIRARIGSLTKDIDLEKERYLRFARELDAFISQVRGSDLQLAAMFRESVQQSYANWDISQIKGFVEQYTAGGTLLAIAQMKEMGVTDAEIATMLAVFDLLDACEGKSDEEVRAMMKEALRDFSQAEDPSLHDFLRTIAEHPEEIAVEVLNYKKKTMAAWLARNAKATKMLDAQRRVAAARLRKLLDDISASAQALNTGKASTSTATLLALREKWLQQLRQHKETLANMGKLGHAKLEALTKRGKWTIGGGIAAIQLSVEAYRQVVVNGKSWDDALEDVALLGIELAGGAIANKIIPSVGERIVGKALARLSGTLWIAAAITLYDLTIRDWAELKMEEIEDYAEEQWW
jgi:hypothetical protein